MHTFLTSTGEMLIAKTLWETTPSEETYFWEESYDSLKILNLRKSSGMKPFSGIWKHAFVQHGCFFAGLFPCNFNDQLIPYFWDLLFHAHIGIHKWESWSLILAKVSSSFKSYMYKCTCSLCDYFVAVFITVDFKVLFYFIFNM